jgi:hypothetical protein
VQKLQEDLTSLFPIFDPSLAGRYAFGLNSSQHIFGDYARCRHAIDAGELSRGQDNAGILMRQAVSEIPSQQDAIGN